MSKPLTAAAVAKMKPGKDRREIPDGGCPGLYLIIQPSGAKGWALRYRRPDDRPAKLVLGSVYFDGAGDEPNIVPAIGGHLTLAAAHALVATCVTRSPRAATRLLHTPGEAKRRAAAEHAAANTFAGAARDFIAQYARPKVRRWQELSRLLGLQPGDDLATIPNGLAERWAGRPITEIDGHDIHAVVDETRRFGAPGSRRRSDGPTEARARAMYSVLSKMFAWLVQHRRVAVNPCASVHRPETPKARDRVLTNDEIGAFWRATERRRSVHRAVQAAALTGCRRDEVGGMRWEELSEDGTAWTIPGSRTKNHRAHVVPLPPLAREILAGVERIEGCLACSRQRQVALAGWPKIKARLDAAMKPAAPWVLHDLRRTAATGMAELGIAPHIVEAVLNHVCGAKAGVAGVYNRAVYAPEKKAALERWAAHVAGLVSGKPANVVTMARAQT